MCEVYLKKSLKWASYFKSSKSGPTFSFVGYDNQKDLQRVGLCKDLLILNFYMYICLCGCIPCALLWRPQEDVGYS